MSIQSSILVGRGLLAEPGRWARPLGKRVCLVSEPGAFGLFGRDLLAALRREEVVCASHLLPEGEAAKTPASLAALYRTMVHAGLGRDSGVAALGGGAVTDTAGFAAATYLRGIAWVSLPTTLLGQVDSGIGGKVGVNLPEGKNLIGTFHQPCRVVCDLDALGTLSARERLSGLGEALKYGLVFDARFWRRMVAQWDRLLRLEPGPLAAVVRRCARQKAWVVTLDERESRGMRELLNFGHTFGHALEAATGFSAFRHGEAVITGMRAALALSVAKSGLDLDEAREAGAFLASLPVPPIPRGLGWAALLRHMLRDKKARGGRLRFVLLRRLGRPVVMAVEAAAAARAWETLA